MTDLDNLIAPLAQALSKASEESGVPVSRMFSGPIMAHEVADVFRQAIRGEIPVIRCDTSESWTDTFAGNVSFYFGQWRITFYNDCDCLDYVDEVLAPDGRMSGYHDWVENSRDANGHATCDTPDELLSLEEQYALEALLVAAG